MMIAKFKVTSVTEQKNDKQETTSEQIKMMAVTSKPFDKDGNSEDNSFARWTPSGELTMTISNTNLFGQLKTEQPFYLHFTPAES
jgi:hypothetical protein